MKIVVDMKRTPDYNLKNEFYDLDYGYNREGEVIYDLDDSNIFECIAACLDAMTLENYPLETIDKIKEYITDLEWPEEEEKEHELIPLTREEFEDQFCSLCGTQRCDGIDSEWFEGCEHKELLKQDVEQEK